MRDTRSLVATNIERLDIRNSNAADLATEVRSQLLLSGVEISADADYSLRLVNEHYNRTVLTVSPVTGKVEEYTMTLTVALSIGKKGRKKSWQMMSSPCPATIYSTKMHCWARPAKKTSSVPTSVSRQRPPLSGD